MIRLVPLLRSVRPLAVRAVQLVAVVAGTLAFGAPTALAQGASDAATIYRLNPASNYEQGCFGPCMCPILVGTDVRGTFVLTSTGFDGLFNTYAVTDVNWSVASGDEELRVTGSGTYKVGGGLAVQQELALDLRIGDSVGQRFDGGLVGRGGEFPGSSATRAVRGPAGLQASV